MPSDTIAPEYCPEHLEPISGRDCLATGPDTCDLDKCGGDCGCDEPYCRECLRDYNDEGDEDDYL